MPSKGILLVNLGSPDSASIGNVRRYLGEFLMDGRVMDLPLVLRWLLVKGVILPVRSQRSAEAYRSIWREAGSPLIAISKQVQSQLGSKLDAPVELGMRYGNPAIKTALGRLLSQGVKEIFLLPMYPHYSMATFETVVVAVRKVMASLDGNAQMTVVPPFFDHPDYIEALYQSAVPYLAEPYDHLLFSFHGIPERHLRKRDLTGEHCLRSEGCCEVDRPSVHQFCYRAQAFQTVRAFVSRAGIPQGQYSVSFQSRLGRAAWLRPYTENVIARLAASGAKNLVVLCPSFVADCLETLEEVGMRGRRQFSEAGGESFTLIPSLNDHPVWVMALSRWCTDWLDGGRTTSGWEGSIPADWVR